MYGLQQSAYAGQQYAAPAQSAYSYTAAQPQSYTAAQPQSYTAAPQQQTAYYGGQQQQATQAAQQYAAAATHSYQAQAQTPYQQYSANAQYAAKPAGQQYGQYNAGQYNAGQYNAQQMQQYQASPMPPGSPGKHNQVVHGVVNPPHNQAWTSSLYSCFDDGFICCLGWAVPACLYGENYRKLHNEGWFGCCLLYYFCGCFSCFFANTTRATLRSKYGLPEEPCGDCCVHCWCSPCAVCQEARELRARERWQTWAK